MYCVLYLLINYTKINIYHVLFETYVLTGSLIDLSVSVYENRSQSWQNDLKQMCKF